MKKILIVTFALSFTYCKKDYICECSNPRGVYATYNINDTQKKLRESAMKNAVLVHLQPRSIAS